MDGEPFYAWECVSLVRPCGTTFDLVVKDSEHLLALIHLVHRNIHRSSSSVHMYKLMMLKMKV